MHNVDVEWGNIKKQNAFVSKPKFVSFFMKYGKKCSWSLGCQNFFGKPPNIWDI